MTDPDTIDITDEAQDTLSPSQVREQMLQWSDETQASWPEVNPMPEPAAGWVTPPVPAAHPCEIPDFTRENAGRTWRCGECGEEWVLQRQSLTGLSQAPMAFPRNTTSLGVVDMTATLVERGHNNGCSLVLAKGICDCPMNPAVRGKSAQQ